MLPDFPKIKEELLARAAAYIEHLVRQEPLLADVPRIHHFEGSDMQTTPSVGPVQSGGYERYSSPNFHVATDEIIGKGHVAFFEHLQALAEDLKAHQVRTMLTRVGESADAIGNVVHAGGRPYGPDVFLEALETITIPFDEDGTPQMPRMVVSPEVAAYVRAHATEWEADPAFRERHAKILRRKREEWDDRERHRELVE
jgi:hypothetical protein